MSKPKPEETPTPTITRLPLPEKCSCCDDDGPIVLASHCHTGAGVFAVLTGNILTLVCSVCEQVVTRLEVTCQVRLG
jgi:hypothetical protein